MAVYKQIFSFILLDLLCHVSLTVTQGYDDYDLEPVSSPKTGYACEGSTLTIQCTPGMQIRIIKANYGRYNLGICNDGHSTEQWDLRCQSSRSLRIVSESCDNKLLERCDIPATNRNFGDPCNLTPKYLEVQYRCETVSKIPDPHYGFSPIPVQDPDTSHTEPNVIERSTLRTLSDGTVLSSPGKDNGLTIFPSLTPTPSNHGSGEVKYCEKRDARNVTWPRTEAGRTVEAECPNNRRVKKATWECGSARSSSMSTVDWVNRPNLTECVSPTVIGIGKSLDSSKDYFSPTLVEQVAYDMVAATDHGEVIYGGDLTHITEAMQKTIDEVEVHVHEVTALQATQLVHKVNDAVLNTSSNLLEERHSEAWRDLPQSTQAETATRLIDSVESSAFQVARHIQKPTIVINITVNIVVEIRVIDVSASEAVSDASFTPRFQGRDKGGIKDSGTGKQFPVDTRSHVQDTTWNECGDSITLTGNTIRQLGQDGLVKVVFATYDNLDQYMNPQYVGTGIGPDGIPEIHVKHREPVQMDHYGIEEQKGPDAATVYPPEEDDDELKDKIVATRIISAAVNDRKDEKTELLEPIIYTLEHRTDVDVYNPSCSFWEYQEKTMNGKWSTFGCQLLDTNQTHTKCACKHLTNFAVLMSVTGRKMAVVHEFTLALITYLGCIASIICLIAAFITFVCFKNLQCDRNTIHKNLVLTLCLAEIVFLCGIMQYKKKILCSVVAVVLHYLFLTAFAWMSIEGIQLYVMLVEVFESEKSRVKWYYAAAYGIPAVIVAVSAGIDHTGYTWTTLTTRRHCWLSSRNGFIWSFVGPACAIICVNLVMLSIAIYVMCRHANNTANQWKMKQKGRVENIKTWIKGAVVLVVLLGLTWIFGVFNVDSLSSGVSDFMAYAFTILNCLQGVFIFVFHCLMNEKVQKEYKKVVRHTTWLPENFRIKYGGAKPPTSTTPVNSTSSGVNKILREQKFSVEYLTRLLSNRRRKRSSTTSLPTSTDPIRQNGYNKMLRDSSGRDSAFGDRVSGKTDSGIACNDSHIYSEPTEDPAAYLDPVRIKLDADEEMCLGAGADVSLIEGSIVDTDYMDKLTQRASHSSPQAINIDKYKIRVPNSKRHGGPQKSISESDYSDGEPSSENPPSYDTLNSYTPEPATNSLNSRDSSINKKLPLTNDHSLRGNPQGANKKMTPGNSAPPLPPFPESFVHSKAAGKTLHDRQTSGIHEGINNRPPALPQRNMWNSLQDEGVRPPSDC